MSDQNDLKNYGGDPGKTFTQDDVDRIVGERLVREKDRFKVEKADLLRQYNEVLENHRLTDEQRRTYEARVNELESQVLSKDELAVKRLRQREEEWAAKFKHMDEKLSHSKKQHESFRIRTEILEAASVSRALNPSQVLGLLAPSAQVEEILDDQGKFTGQYRVMVPVAVEQDGQAVEKSLPVREAVKVFLEQPSNFNLVKSTVKGGSGFQPSSSSLDSAHLMKLSAVERLKAARRKT
jgi:hypothetical protein